MFNLLMSAILIAVIILLSLMTSPVMIVYLFLGSVFLPKDRERCLSQALFQILIWPVLIITSTKEE